MRSSAVTPILAAQRGAALAAAILLCGVLSFAAHAASLTEPGIGFSFDPGKSGFEFVFAKRDAKSYYTLAYVLQKKQLLLTKTLGGFAAKVAANNEMPPFTRVNVWLRPFEIRVEADGRTVIRSSDTTFRTGTRELRVVGVAGAKVQEIAQVAEWSENFENHDAARDRWKTLSGSWSILAPVDDLVLRDNGPPMFSVYRCDGEDRNLAAPEQPICANFRLRAKLRIEGMVKAGVAFNINDPANFSAFLIAPGEEGAGGAQLLDFRDDKPQALGTVEPVDLGPEAVEPNQWHELMVESCGDQAWCSVDGRLAFAGFRLPGATGTGRIGLISWGAGALFDDVRVEGVAAYAERFDTPNIGAWEVTGELAAKGGRLAGTGTAKLKAMPPNVCRIDAEVDLKPDCDAGVFAHFANAGAFYAFGYFEREWQFRQSISGKQSVLARAAAADAGRHRITLIDRCGRFVCLVDGRQVLELCDAALPPGNAGLIGRNAAFGDFRVIEAAPGEGVEILATDFRELKSRDKIAMREGWILGDLLKPSAVAWERKQVEGGAVLACSGSASLTFRERIPGDVAVAAKVSLSGASAAAIQMGAQGAGYAFGPDAEGANLVFACRGAVIAKRPINGKPATVSVELIKRGPTVLAYADSKLVCKLPDPAPSTGKVGFTGGPGAALHSVSLRALNASAYPFNEMPAGWRELGGKWLLRGGVPVPGLTHWITGVSEAEPCALQERLDRSGDIAWFVTVAPDIEGFPDGGSKQYPIKNVSLGFCSQPGKLDSGYAFVLRPDGRKTVRLLRNGKVVVEDSVMTLEDKPVRVGISELAGRIEVSLDGAPVLSFTDPAPLDAGRLWLGLDHSRARFLDVLVCPN